MFPSRVDGTVLAVAVPSLAVDLKPSYTQILWISDIYVRSRRTAGDDGKPWRPVRRKRLMLGALGFGAMSVVAVYAPTRTADRGPRCAGGFGGATLIPTLALIRAVFTESRQRTLAIGIWSATGSAGPRSAPSSPGLLLEHFWWVRSS